MGEMGDMGMMGGMGIMGQSVGVFIPPILLILPIPPISLSPNAKRPGGVFALPGRWDVVRTVGAVLFGFQGVAVTSPLLRVFYNPFLAKDGDFDLTGVLHFRLDALRNVSREDGCFVVVDAFGFDHDA